MIQYEHVVSTGYICKWYRIHTFYVPSNFFYSLISYKYFTFFFLKIKCVICFSLSFFLIQITLEVRNFVPM